MKATCLFIPRNWPLPCDEGAATRILERFREVDENGLLGIPGVLPMLRCLGGNSPYLASLATREPEVIHLLVTAGPAAALAQSLFSLDQVSVSAGRAQIAAAIREVKRRVALIAAIADIGGIWPLENVAGAMSTLAESTLRLSVRHLLRSAHDSGEIHLQDPLRPDLNCGFVVLAMGKLGGAELNYSSDIDLILLYDGTSSAYGRGTAAARISSFTSRLARNLVMLMEARDADGYVFRTDLRLRPDPAATPPAVSLHAALIYYETMGQNWERAAMIKARPVAGDVPLGHRFLEAIRPFVWRRGLDFAAVADIHAMKRRIDMAGRTAPARMADPVARIAGHDVKLGGGGIREIEFLVQTLQMIWGGRDPTLRVKPTLPALVRLTQAGHLPKEAGRQLAESYRFLRRVEHRIQMVNDRQTHRLPEPVGELVQIASFLGYQDATAFALDFLRHVSVVRANYQATFEQVPDLAGTEAVGPDLDFRGDDPQPAATVAALNGLGYQDATRIIMAVRQWLAGRVRALRSSRARDLMTTMIPTMLIALGRQPNPDEAFNRFDRFISALPAGVQPMSLFQRNPILLERIAAVLGAAPILSEHLARYPTALEGLLTTENADPRRLVRAQMANAVTLEDAVLAVRRTVKERDFFLSVATLEGRLDADASGRQRTALAEAVLSTLVPRAIADFASRFGHVRGGALAVVAMGKAGGREMMAGSDLDLMFIYDYPVGVDESRGGRGLPTSQWFGRAAQACIAALTAPGAEGRMYELDMRLRPSGSKGPIAVSLEGFRHYHEWDSWTWERMALTRARVVAGPPALRRRVNEVIEAAIRRQRDSRQIRINAQKMRERIGRETRSDRPWEVKLRVGGLVDIEFIAQTLQLIHADDCGFCRSQTTRVALKRLMDVGAISKPDGRFLIKAERLWRTIQGMLRITVGHFETASLPYASAIPLLQATARAGVAARDADDLLEKSDKMAKDVRMMFERYVGG